MNTPFTQKHMRQSQALLKATKTQYMYIIDYLTHKYSLYLGSQSSLMITNK